MRRSEERAGGVAAGIAERRVQLTQRALAAAVFAQAAAWAIAAAVWLVAALATLDVLAGLPLAVRASMLPMPVAAALAVAVAVVWRSRTVASSESVALWIEEQVPRLQYALVTAADPRHARARPALEPLVRDVSWGGALATRALRRLLLPLLLVLLALAATAVLPEGAVARVRSPSAGDALDRARPTGSAASEGLSPLVAVVVPPEYTGERERTIEEPSAIAAPVGSAVTIRGRGDAGSIVVEIDGRPQAVTAERDRWRVVFAMPASPRVVRLSRDRATRLVALEPRPDSAPTLVLSLPQRDSVLAAPSGQVTLAATARDDYGIARTAFEYIVTSGSGEQFSFREGTLAGRAGNGGRQLEMRAELALEALGLGPGDVVHLRAVAVDGNTVSGPGRGVSETRSIRVLRIGEHDSVAVEGAPPPEPDRAALSQRMLIMLAEALEAQRPRLDRPVVVRESRTLARDQGRLRTLVGEIIFMRLGDDPSGEHAHGPGDGHEHGPEELERLFRPESLLAAADRATGGRGDPEALDYAHGESPVVAINRPLLEAYNHMWDAGRELEQGEPGLALPAMRRALDALQEARQAERYYMRGRPPSIVVDIDQVRLARREHVTPSAREPRPSDDVGAERRAARFVAAVELLADHPAAAMDTLLVLRIDALADAPALARALDEALVALRSGRDATPALVRARRAIEGGGAAAGPLGRWSGVW